MVRLTIFSLLAFWTYVVFVSLIYGKHVKVCLKLVSKAPWDEHAIKISLFCQLLQIQNPTLKEFTSSNQYLMVLKLYHLNVVILCIGYSNNISHPIVHNLISIDHSSVHKNPLYLHPPKKMSTLPQSVSSTLTGSLVLQRYFTWEISTISQLWGPLLNPCTKQSLLRLRIMGFPLDARFLGQFDKLITSWAL